MLPIGMPDPKKKRTHRGGRRGKKRFHQTPDGKPEDHFEAAKQAMEAGRMGEAKAHAFKLVRALHALHQSAHGNHPMESGFLAPATPKPAAKPTGLSAKARLAKALKQRRK